MPFQFDVGVRFLLASCTLFNHWCWSPANSCHRESWVIQVIGLILWKRFSIFRSMWAQPLLAPSWDYVRTSRRRRAPHRGVWTQFSCRTRRRVLIGCSHVVLWFPLGRDLYRLSRGSLYSCKLRGRRALTRIRVEVWIKIQALVLLLGL